ncbi:MAG: helix-turn-helix domain-containing protein [Nitrospirae bacterium]|nr:helix-turn-helix domain-containing protein [Nitrospirota bacterium]MDA8214157.1 helix-turn-helix transcriptional regulator [Nitrospiraceae bacterium]MDA8338328.1 helix-turn-helix transcriptional regulator [Nitrospiraceae bacterium]
MQKKKIKTSREIGEKIKRRRKELGISQEELAETLGVTYQQVQRYENGTNKLNVENIQAVADILSVPLSYFFEPEKTLMLAEKRAAYSTAESKLLKYFRKIKNNSSKNAVIQVARIAAKAG